MYEIHRKAKKTPTQVQYARELNTQQVEGH